MPRLSRQRFSSVPRASGEPCLVLISLFQFGPLNMIHVCFGWKLLITSSLQIIEFGSEPVVFHLDMTIELLGQSELFKLVHSLLLSVTAIILYIKALDFLLLPR